jgi:HK97 family phage major capsid protein
MEGLARERSAVMRLAETVPGLIGEVELPRIVDGATAEFLGEDDEAPEVETEYGLLTLRPKTVGCHLEMTRRFVKDAVPGTEAMIRRDLAQALASAMDYSFLTGQGGRHHPIGLLNWTGIGAVTGGTDGAAPAFEHLVALESELAAANLDAGRLAYLTNSDVRGKLKRTPQHATANVGGWCWEAYPGQADPTVGMVNGYPAHVSNLVPSNLDKGSSTGVCSAIIFADWAKVVVGLFGALRLIVDPYSGSKRGRVRLVAFLDADMVVRQAGAVAAMQDVLTVG